MKIGKQFKIKLQRLLSNFFQYKNETQVILVGITSFFIILLFLLILLCLVGKTLWQSNGIWTLVTAVFSSPILFIIWRFRDKNATEQIHNQRKDVNLKEFHKIAEWISGNNFSGTNSNIFDTGSTEIVQSEVFDYLYTFNKSKGAIALQISAIYNLQPFYTGEYGKTFQKPALNLLLSAWLALQCDELEKLANSSSDEDVRNIIKKLRNNGQTAVGQAITKVLLSNGGETLKCYPEIFPNLCLAGMDFKLPGIRENIIHLFREQFCREINLIGINYPGADFTKTHLTYADFRGATLNGACFKDSVARRCDFTMSSIDVDLDNGDFYGSKFDDIKLPLIDIFSSAKNIDQASFKNSINIPQSIQCKLDSNSIYQK